MSENVYKKLQQARAILKTKEIKESGNNRFAGYTYMELGDFLPAIVDICNDLGLCPVVCFAEISTLTIVNSDNPEEKIVFTSPMSTAELKGCHAIQNLGAVETYLRRYLYVNAFDIVEHDALDSTHGKQDTAKLKPVQEATKPATQAPITSEGDKDYLQRVKIALRTIYGDDIQGGLNKVEELTSFTGKDGREVKGIKDLTKITGKRLEILCHNLEKLVPKLEADTSCGFCGEEHPVSAPCSTDICQECGSAKSKGACRNYACPEGKPLEGE